MSKRAIVEVIDNLISESTTDALSANQGRILKELIDSITSKDKNIMTAKLGSTISNTVGGTYTNLNLVLSNFIGDKLTIQNGGIKIGSGVSKVKVNANLKIATNTVGNKHARILKNTTSVGWGISRGISAGDESSISVSPLLIDVSEDDILYLAYYAAAGDGISANYNATYLTVEVVE